MGFARLSMGRLPHVEFWKLLGSGVGEGFTPIPNTSVYGILTVWPDLETAKQEIARQSVFHRYRTQAAENWTIFMHASSSRGQWSGQAPFRVGASEPSANIVALTRATIKPRILLKFWRRVPNISAVIGSDPNVKLKIGLGEVPWLHQITFSIWPDVNSMAAFARKSGPHADAIRAVREGNWFSEELYARFAICEEQGHWPAYKKKEAA